MNNKDYLMHYGVKGQQWGRRRYQNEDGSYKRGAEGRYDPEPKTNPNVVRNPYNWNRSAQYLTKENKHGQKVSEVGVKDWKKTHQDIRINKNHNPGLYRKEDSSDKEETKKSGNGYKIYAIQGNVQKEESPKEKTTGEKVQSKVNPYLDKAKNAAKDIYGNVKDFAEYTYDNAKEALAWVGNKDKNTHFAPGTTIYKYPSGKDGTVIQKNIDDKRNTVSVYNWNNEGHRQDYARGGRMDNFEKANHQINKAVEKVKDTVNPYLNKAKSAVKDTATKAEAAIKSNVIIPVKKATASAISNTNGKVTNFVRDTVDDIKRDTKKVVDSIAKNEDKVKAKNVVSGGNKKQETVVDTVKNATNAATQTVSSLVNNAKTKSASTISSIKSYVSTSKASASSLVSSSKNAITKAKNWISSLFKK